MSVSSLSNSFCWYWIAKHARLCVKSLRTAMAGGRALVQRKGSKKAKKDKEKTEQSQSLTEQLKSIWGTLKAYGTFIVPDPDGEEKEGHKFARGNVNVAPGEPIEPEDYWVAAIKDIRAKNNEDGTNQVTSSDTHHTFSTSSRTLLVINWPLRHTKDFPQIIVTYFYPTHSTLLKNMASTLNPITSEVLSMHEFVENDPEQPYIPREAFYFRYTLDRKRRTTKPKPGSCGCTCVQPYNPNDTDPSHIMHFCPRPGCRRAFHQACLLKAGPVVDQTTTNSASGSRPKRKVSQKSSDDAPLPNDRALRLLACSPDTDDEVDLLSLIPLSVQVVSPNTPESRPSKKRRGKESAIPPPPVSTRSQDSSRLTKALSAIPADLLKVAQQPIVRGGAFVLGGVAGNVSFVTRARRLTYHILQGNDVPADWKDQIFPRESGCDIANALVKIPGSRKALPAVKVTPSSPKTYNETRDFRHRHPSGPLSGEQVRELAKASIYAQATLNNFIESGTPALAAKYHTQLRDVVSKYNRINGQPEPEPAGPTDAMNVVHLGVAGQLAALTATINNLSDTLNARVTSLENTFNARMTTLENTFNARLTTLENTLNARVTTLEEQITRVESKLDRIESKVDRIEVEMRQAIEGSGL
ncbi:hypothetical protein D9613_011078 [Agrocybe pediades]|uniref:Uncharacterized protein n=1 Tax=Agrocybe pediades TaxID=84607 RepID=A0A8H4QLN3_9AGAR|nr:hypothetical protein D9613_011078 [Agrocybe pediades]